MFCHVKFCTLNVHINICFCMGFCHAHLCTNYYPYSYGFLSCTSLYGWLSIIFLYGFRHLRLCTNDYPYSNGFSSRTSLYGWLPISLCMGFCHAHLCTNDYPFLLNGFLSCTCLYEWLSISSWMGFRPVHDKTNNEWIFIVQKCARRKPMHNNMDSHRTNMYMTKSHTNMDSQSYKHVDDENPYKNIC